MKVVSRRCSIASSGVFFFALNVVLFAVSFSVEAQQPPKVARIGYLDNVPLSAIASRIEAFRQGLRDLGYVDGANIVIEWKSAENKVDRLPALAAELVRLKVDVIVTAGATVTRAAKEATTTIPIVMAQDPDPVGNTFIASLARPGGNITGLSSLAADLSGKRLELLKEILLKLSRLAVFETSTNTGNARQMKETELAAESFGMKIQRVDVKGPNDIEIAFKSAMKGRADGVLVLTSAVTDAYQTEIAGFAVKSRLPVMYARAEAAEAGGLVSYGVSIADMYRRAATYVDKILKGTKPGDLPVEQPTKFEFVINLKAAKQIGLTIPPNVLARADKVIK